jgi:hypothetical protein
MNTGDPQHDALMAVARSLTEAEADGIRAFAAACGLDGAEPADWIAEADNADAYLDRIELMFTEHGSELPAVPGVSFVMYAIIALDLPLTAVNVKKMLLRAGLLPPVTPVLEWAVYSAGAAGPVAGYIAEGETEKYFVTRTPDRRFLLCRWDKNLAAPELEAMRQAASTLIEVSTPDEGRRFAESFERGEGIGHVVAWQHSPRPGLAVSTARFIEDQATAWPVSP